MRYTKTKVKLDNKDKKLLYTDFKKRIFIAYLLMIIAGIMFFTAFIIKDPENGKNIKQAISLTTFIFIIAFIITLYIFINAYLKFQKKIKENNKTVIKGSIIGKETEVRTYQDDNGKTKELWTYYLCFRSSIGTHTTKLKVDEQIYLEFEKHDTVELHSLDNKKSFHYYQKI